MSAKIFSLILVLLLTAPAIAQKPMIDSIAVDEDKGELVLRGNFQNSGSAVVLVDSVSLPVTLASDTLIRTRILVSGKGSAGWVSVRVGADESNKKLLTYIHFWVYFTWTYWDARMGRINDLIADTVSLRSDFSSLMTSANTIYLTSSKLSRCHDKAEIDAGFGNCSGFDSSGILRTIVEYQNNTLEYSLNYFEFGCSGGGGFIEIKFDENFTPKARASNWQQGNGVGNLNIGPTAQTDFPPIASSVHEASINPNILQARLTSDPIALYADIIITLRESMKVRMEIMDILGHIVFSDERMLSACENKLPINSSRLPSGIYICRLQAGSEVVSVRFVKE